MLGLVNLLLLLGAASSSRCPYGHGGADDLLPLETTNNQRVSPELYSLMKAVDYTAVMEDLTLLMTDSQPSWPADYEHYGPLMVRLAWHSAGSYRRSDGRGGVDGARQRFEPERSWDDNTNLDKARALLWPIKNKYGPGLSWGDLIVLAGNTAIESMGLPVLGFCGGRIDDHDGSDSLLLGPSAEQADQMPCVTNGLCQEPLGASTVGLIYVNPEGPLASGVPAESVEDIRDTFGRMNMDDRETVALIGGGHAFGKTHGACPTGPGPKPVEDPVNPWPGTCGTGKLEDTFTSGFELPFTTNPIRWDNEYFTNLRDLDYEKFIGPGGHQQWRVAGGVSPTAPSPSLNGTQPIGMLTTDLALLEDPSYLALVNEYANNVTALDIDFANAWYKLTTRDMGPHSRCLGHMVPPPQAWQNPLPAPPTDLADFEEVKTELNILLSENVVTHGLFLRLAWRCAATYRTTDYMGGCNGGRIRLSPQRDWEVNRNLDFAIELLEPIKSSYGPGLSWADLMVLAGNTVMERSTGVSIAFCGGRTDAEADAGASDNLQPRLTGDFGDSLAQLKETARVMGLTQREFAVLNAAGYAIGDYFDCEGLFCRRDSHTGATPGETGLDNIFFVRLLNLTWEEYIVPATGRQLYKSMDSEHFMLQSDMFYRADGELRAIAEEYSYDNAKFLHDVTAAWNKLMTADRFEGPAGNLCA